MQNPFKHHPASVGEGYFEHMGQAFSFAGPMLLAGVACALHGLLPFLFLKTGSTTIVRLNDRMTTHRVKPENMHRLPPAPAK